MFPLEVENTDMVQLCHSVKLMLTERSGAPGLGKILLKMKITPQIFRNHTRRLSHEICR